jgi:ribonuclease HI
VEAKEVWRKLDLLDRVENAMNVDRAGSAALEELIIWHQSEDQVKELILTSAWYIWWIRRQFVHEEKVASVVHAAMSIQIITTNNTRAMKKKSEKRKSVWTKPKEVYVLINVDASYDPDTRMCGLGVVIRDEHGRFLAACTNPISYEIDSNTAEARAVSRGIALANEVGCDRIIIQLDCLQVTETLSSGVFAAAPIYEDIHVQCSTFSKCEFSFCNREANSVADALSKDGFTPECLGR